MLIAGRGEKLWTLPNVLISFFCTHECNNKQFENLSFHICSTDWVFHQHARGHDAPRRCHIGCANDWKSSLDWYTARRQLPPLHMCSPTVSQTVIINYANMKLAVLPKFDTLVSHAVASSDHIKQHNCAVFRSLYTLDLVVSSKNILSATFTGTPKVLTL